MPAGWKPGDPLPPLPPMPPGVRPSCAMQGTGSRLNEVLLLVNCANVSTASRVCGVDTGWKPGDAIPGDGAAKAATSGEPAAQAEPEPGQGQVKPGKELSKNDAFNFILNPEWESVEEDFSEEESE